MSKKKLVPNLRFKEFKGDGSWKLKNFEKLLSRRDGIRRGPFGSALKKDLFVPESNYVVYEQQNAIDNHFKTRYHITEAKYKELINFKVTTGDFIMSGAGTIGRITRVPKGINNGVINQALIRIRINNIVLDSNYFLQWIRSPRMQDKLTEANPASAMMNLVPMSEIKNWEVAVPSKKEQEKIGSFFNNLDNLINLQRDKLAKSKDIKSAYLSELFPKEGE
ncbi:MAG: restriction endonuclease subunit S, partial [Atopostipes suicloacalis]|nr:restriction endonuclease subunit S [Atopostipes suicloacalis]